MGFTHCDLYRHFLHHVRYIYGKPLSFTERDVFDREAELQEAFDSFIKMLKHTTAEYYRLDFSEFGVHNFGIGMDGIIKVKDRIKMYLTIAVESV